MTRWTFDKHLHSTVSSAGGGGAGGWLATQTTATDLINQQDWMGVVVKSREMGEYFDKLTRSRLINSGGEHKQLMG